MNSLDQVMPEVDRLLVSHRTVGNWSLAQICHHLTGAITSSVDGVPFRFPWIVRKTVGPLLVRRILKKGRFPEGIKMPERLLPQPGLDARAEAEALRAAVHYFGMHQGPMADHPLAGPMDLSTWGHFHAIHCAHHLSFALPDLGEHPSNPPSLQSDRRGLPVDPT